MASASVECFRCGAKNPTGQKFCGECGHALQNSALNEEVVAAIKTLVGDTIDKRLQDQNLVEIKTAQAVVTRVTEWAKLFALITAVPLTILLATLGIWGVTSFLDFRNKVESGKVQIAGDINLATTEIQETRAQVDAARTELGSLPTDVKSLQSKVATLEERIGFDSTPGLTPQLKTKLKSALDAFQSYCRQIGLHPKAGNVQVRVETGLEKEAHTDAYYDQDTSKMVVDASRASDPSFALREYMHRTLYPEDLLEAPSPNAPAAKQPSADWVAIESGLASYFAASFLQTSHVDFDDLSKLERLPAERSDIGEATIWGVGVWGSAFWELRNTLGQEDCDKLLAQFWQGLEPNHGDRYPSYAVSRLISLYRDSGGKDVAKVNAIFSRRGIS